jgi:hypothetical protein
MVVLAVRVLLHEEACIDHELKSVEFVMRLERLSSTNSPLSPYRKVLGALDTMLPSVFS